MSQACSRACPKSGLLFLHNNTMGKLSSQRRPSPTHRGQEMLDSWNMHGKEPRRIRLMALTAWRRAKLIRTRLVPTRQAHCLHVEHMPAMSKKTPVSWQRKHLMLLSIGCRNQSSRWPLDCSIAPVPRHIGISAGPSLFRSGEPTKMNRPSAPCRHRTSLEGPKTHTPSLISACSSTLSVACADSSSSCCRTSSCCRMVASCRLHHQQQ